MLVSLRICSFKASRSSRTLRSGFFPPMSMNNKPLGPCCNPSPITLEAVVAAVRTPAVAAVVVAVAARAARAASAAREDTGVLLSRLLGQGLWLPYLRWLRVCAASGFGLRFGFWWASGALYGRFW